MHGQLARSEERRRLFFRPVRELGGLREVALGLRGRAERPGSLTCRVQRIVCSGPQRLGVGGAGVEPVGLDQVRGDHLCNLVLAQRRG